jgi:thymidylate synthase
MQMTTEIINALSARYQADLAENKANMINYLSNSVGVGEHPNVVAEVDKLVSAMADTQGKIDQLKSIIDAINEGSDNRE